MSELNHCPNCGGTPTVWVESSTKRVKCRCGVESVLRPYFCDDEVVISDWNSGKFRGNIQYRGNLTRSLEAELTGKIKN